VHLGDAEVAQAETILIAVADGVLADSLRFSLELEGFATRFCDEQSLFPAISASCVGAGCLVLDQDVFARLIEQAEEGAFAGRGVPVVLMVSQTTKQVLAGAKAAGIAHVVEKPLLGGVLFKAIRQAMDGTRRS
jgi:FixJ family two-component response regulator